MNKVTIVLVGIIVYSVIIQLIIYYKKYFISPKSREFLDMGEHTKKRIIPSMGGIAFFVILPVLYFFFSYKKEFWFLFFSAGLSGLVGFIDDGYKIKRSKGLSVKIKFFLQSLSALFSGFYYWHSFPNLTYIKMFSYTLPLGFFFILWVAFVIMATTHAVNLTDGIDGLAISQVSLIMLFFHFLGGSAFTTQSLLFALFCILFLARNKYPASIFMGDVGAFFLGGLLAGFFLLAKTEIILISAGSVFVLNTVTVILQIFFFTWYKKPLFLFTPYHHALEKKGYSEKKIVLLGSIITCIGILLGIIEYNFY